MPKKEIYSMYWFHNYMKIVMNIYLNLKIDYRFK